MHLDLDDPVALTGFAAPAFDVKGKSSGLVSARAGFRQSGEPFANGGKGAGIGRRIRSRRAPDRGLVNIDDLVEIFESLDILVGAGHGARAIEPPGDRAIKRIDDECRFTASRYAGDAGECTQRNFGVYARKVVSAGALYRKKLPLLAFSPFSGHINPPLARQILRGQAFIPGDDFGGRAFLDYLSAMNTGGGAKVEEIVRGPDGVFIMFNDNHRITQIP